MLKKKLITFKTIRATAGKEKIKTEISKPSKLRQTPPSNQIKKIAMESLKNTPLSLRLPSRVLAGQFETRGGSRTHTQAA